MNIESASLIARKIKKRGNEMKRCICLFISLLLMLSGLLSLFACQSALTVDDAVAVFDDEIYLVRKYGDSMISPIRENIEEDLGHETEITAIVHVINQKTSVPNLEFTYIYEFSVEKDAEWFEGNRSTYVATLDGGRCVRFGKIVIFGTSPVIDTIGK